MNTGNKTEEKKRALKMRRHFAYHAVGKKGTFKRDLHEMTYVVKFKKRIYGKV